MSATVRETAAALRKALREAFPGARFSVRMASGTAYGWLSVSWTDGPTVEQVDAVAAPFAAACRGVNTHRAHSPERMAAALALVQPRVGGAPGEVWIPQAVDRRPVFAPWPHADADLVARIYLQRTECAR